MSYKYLISYKYDFWELLISSNVFNSLYIYHMHRKHKCVSLKVGLQLEISYYSFETHQLTTEH